MERVSLDKFQSLAPHAPVVYAGVPFARAHAARTPDFIPLIHTSGRHAAGIICGSDGTTLRAPFSAPFSAFCTSPTSDPVQLTLDAAAALVGFARSSGMQLEIIAAPGIYGPAGPLAVAALSAAGMRVSRTDIGYALPLWRSPQFGRMRRRCLTRAEALGLHTTIASGSEAAELLPRAYSVVAANRAALGYPLSMTESDLLTAMTAVRATVALTQYGTADVGSAILFDVAPRVRQVIFWGDLPDARPDASVITHLACELRRRCAADGFDWLDLGPATLGGRILPGLAAFKQSLDAEAYSRVSISF